MALFTNLCIVNVCTLPPLATLGALTPNDCPNNAAANLAAAILAMIFTTVLRINLPIF